jgi:hypothetical protein
MQHVRDRVSTARTDGDSGKHGNADSGPHLNRPSPWQANS